MNVENSDMVSRGKSNHGSLTGNGILQELHTTILYGILAYEDLRTRATQLLTRFIMHQIPHSSLLLIMT